MAVDIDTITTMAGVNSVTSSLIAEKGTLIGELIAEEGRIQEIIKKKAEEADAQFLRFMETIPVFKGMNFTTAEEALTKLREKLEEVSEITSSLSTPSIITDIIAGYQSVDSATTEEEINRILMNLLEKEAEITGEGIEKILKGDDIIYNVGMTITKALTNVFGENGKNSVLELLIEAEGNEMKTSIFNKGWNIMKKGGESDSIRAISEKPKEQVAEAVKRYVKYAFGQGSKRHKKIEKIKTIGKALEYMDKDSLEAEVMTKALDGNPVDVLIWGEIVQQQAASTISESSLLTKQNETIKKAIYNKLVGSMSEKANLAYFNTLYNKTIDRMLRDNPKLFYLGKNEKNVTGLLGELQTGMFLKHLGFDEGNSTWIAQKTHGGKQYSADWMVSRVVSEENSEKILEYFGIQVKNSSWGNKKISFGTFDFNTMASELSAALGDTINIDIGKINEFIRNIMIINQFNVMYIRAGRHAKEGYNDIFQPSRARIENELVPAATQVLSVCSAVMLHIQTVAQMFPEGSIAGINTNVLYMINGAAYSAGQMLHAIGKNQGFSISTSLTDSMYNQIKSTVKKDDKNVGTIVDWINKGNKVSDVSDYVRVTSSFDFSVLD